IAVIHVHGVHLLPNSFLCALCVFVVKFSSANQGFTSPSGVHGATAGGFRRLHPPYGFSFIVSRSFLRPRRSSPPTAVLLRFICRAIASTVQPCKCFSSTATRWSSGNWSSASDNWRSSSCRTVRSRGESAEL